MRLITTLLTVALILPSAATARIVAKPASTLRAGAVVAPALLVSPGLTPLTFAAAPSLTPVLPSLTPVLPALTPAALPVAAAVRPAAVPAAAKKYPAVIKGLRETVKTLEKKKGTAKQAAALGAAFDGGMTAMGASPVAAGVSAPAVSGLSAPSPRAVNSAAEPSALPLRPVSGSLYERVPRPWGGRLKAALFRGWNEIQRIRKGKPKIQIEKAVEGDLERLVAITETVRLAAQESKSAAESSDSGFLAWKYDVPYFRQYLNHPDATIWVGRGADGVVLGFAVEYGKGVMDPADPGQEYNVVLRRAMERRYGPDVEFLLVKQMAVDPTYARSGAGRQLGHHMIARLLEHGIDFVATTIVNDDPLHGTRYDVPEAKLVRNNASAGLAVSMRGERIGRGFLYTKEIARFDEDRAKLTVGIHAFDMYGLSLNKRRRMPQLEIPAKNRAPGI